MTQTDIIEVADLDFKLRPGAWDFAVDRAGEIQAHWQLRKAEKPQLFNGRVLMLGAHEYVSRPEGDVTLRGDFLESAFADFLAWREFGFPASNACNCFSMAALRGSDGAFLLGEMASHTASAGAIYFAAGTPDPQDAFGDRVDLEASVTRELFEETGVLAQDTRYDKSWIVAPSLGRIACIKLMSLTISADEAKAGIDAFLASDPQAELLRMHVVRSEADFHERMPEFVRAFMRYVFARE